MSPLQLLRIPLYYDFASSLCYVAHRVFEGLAPELRELDVEIEWRPLDLAGLLNWERGAPVPPARLKNAERVARELEIRVCTPRRWIDSRPALAVALRQADPRIEAEWREHVWTSVFEHGRGDELCAQTPQLAEEHGLQFASKDLEAGLLQLEQHTRAAAEASVTGAPTLMLAGFPIAGIQTPDTMLDMLGRYVRRVRETKSGHETLQ